MCTKNPLLKSCYFLVILITISFSAKAANPHLVQNFNTQRPFSFEENKGQLADEKGNLLSDILYFGREKGVNVYCFKDKIAFVFTKLSAPRPPEGGEVAGSPFRVRPNHSGGLGGDSTIVTASRIEMQLVNANPAVQLIAEQPQEAYSNYYLAHCPDGITAHSFNKLTYKNIYPAIDLVLSTNGKGMEYSFIVYPGGDVNNIRMRWNGADSMKYLQEQGVIRYANSLGSLQEGKLQSYLQDGQKVDCSYKVQGNEVGFDVKNYDKGGVLVIDPAIIWSTTRKFDLGNFNIYAGDSGYIFFTGETFFYGFSTTGAYQRTINGTEDAVVGKLDSKGSLKWGTYFGGNNDEWGTSVTSRSGKVYMAGTTTSVSKIATSGTYQTAYRYSLVNNAFLVSFTNSGALRWATYYGGNYETHPVKVVADDSNYVYIAGYTSNTSGIGSSGSYQSSNGGGADAFVAKFNDKGGLAWDTYFGGPGGDEGYAMAIDSKRNVYIAGKTMSASKIATAGALQTSFGGKSDIFVAKFSTAGSLLFSTYYGDSEDETANDMVLDSSGNTYVAGWSASSGLATSGTYKTAGPSGEDVLIFKMDPKGGLVWSTYFGGSGDDEANAIGIDSLNNTYITGWTKSTSGIATRGVFQYSYGGGTTDGFVAKFRPSTALDWSSYYGGGGADEGTHIAVPNNKMIYVTGGTTSDWNPTKNGMFSSIANIYSTEFMTAFQSYRTEYDAGVWNINNPYYNNCGGKEPINITLGNYGTKNIDSLHVAWSLNGTLMSDNTLKKTIYPDSVLTMTIDTYTFSGGVYDIKIWTYKPNGILDSTAYNDTASITINITNIPALTGSDFTTCKGNKIALGGLSISGHYYKWRSDPPGVTSTQGRIELQPDTTTTYYLTESLLNGCSKTDSVTVTIVPHVIANTGPDQVICQGDTATIGLPAVKMHTYSWISNPVGFISSLANPKVHPDTSTMYYLTESDGYCDSMNSVRVTVIKSPVVDAGPDQLICYGDSAVLGSAPIAGRSYYWYSKEDRSISTNSRVIVSPQSNTMYYLRCTIDSSGCSSTDSVMVRIKNNIHPSAGPDADICIGDSIWIGKLQNYRYTCTWISVGNIITHRPMFIVKPTKTTTYYLAGIDTATGCHMGDTVTVNVHSRPSIAVYGTNTDICVNTINQIRIPADTSGLSFKWYSGRAKIIINADKPIVGILWDKLLTDTLWATATNHFGCKDSARFIVTVHALPDAHFSVSNNGKVYTFKGQDSTLKTYSWSYSDSTAMDTGNVVSHIFGHNRSYKITLVTANSFGCVSTYDSTISITVSGLAENTREDNSISIYPNPFSNTTNIFYSLQKPSQVSIEVLDMQGRKLSTLVQGNQLPGSHSCEFDAGKYNCSAGIYLVKVLIADQVAVRRIVRIE